MFLSLLLVNSNHQKPWKMLDSAPLPRQQIQNLKILNVEQILLALYGVIPSALALFFPMFCCCCFYFF